MAGGYTAWGVPTRIDVVRNEGVMVYGPFGNPAGCTVTDQFFVAYSSTQYAQIYAALLTAIAAGKQIQVYAGSCAPATWYAVASTTYNLVTGGEVVNISN